MKYAGSAVPQLLTGRKSALIIAYSLLPMWYWLYLFLLVSGSVLSFISIIFLLFAPTVFFAYFVTPQRFRWFLLLCSSYLFYAYWDWRYIPLLFASSLVDYLCALGMAKHKSRISRRPYLLLSLAVNLGVLFGFKYWNFVGFNINQLFGSHIELHHLLLPLGLSFYTLQTLSYTFDVYLDKIKPEKHLGYFCLYVSFFPQLVAGPIERSRSLLPQLKSLSRPTLYQFRYGLLLMLWGFFIKLVIADNLTPFINAVYFTEEVFQVWIYWLVGALVTFKVYCDFMAYSEIARGLAMLFGVKLTVNFRRPLLATHLRGFWQRWHISLTRWIGDYIQIPLLRRFPKEPSRSLVTLVTLMIIGLWHGASWNFILFGLFHGTVLVLWGPAVKSLKRLGIYSANHSNAWGRLCLALVLMFSAPMFFIVDTDVLFSVLRNMTGLSGSADLFSVFKVHGKFLMAQACIGLILLSLFSYRAEYHANDIIECVSHISSVARWLTAIGVGLVILLLGKFSSEPFIYFEF